MPLQRLHLYLSYRCNLRCSFCYTDGVLGTVRDMPIELVKDLHRHWPRVARWHLNGPGETLMHSGFEEIAQWLLRRRKVVSFLTNGVRLEGVSIPLARFAFVAISLNEVERDAYAELCGRDHFDRALAGFEKALASGAVVLVSFVVDEENIHRVPEYVRFLREHPRARGKIVAKRTNEGPLGGPCRLEGASMLQLRELQREYGGDVSFAMARSTSVGHGLCEPIRHMLVVNGDGDVAGCCRGEGPRPELGSVLEAGRAVRSSEGFRRLLAAVASDKPPPKCYHCTHARGRGHGT
jgi:sulfatase maturation enzyme AslB (radical SAM superfamily)